MVSSRLSRLIEGPASCKLVVAQETVASPGGSSWTSRSRTRQMTEMTKEGYPAVWDEYSAFEVEYFFGEDIRK